MHVPHKRYIYCSTIDPLDLHEILACIRLQCQDNEISGHTKVKVSTYISGGGGTCAGLQDMQCMYPLLVMIMSLGTARFGEVKVVST